MVYVHTIGWFRLTLPVTLSSCLRSRPTKSCRVLRRRDRDGDDEAGGKLCKRLRPTPNAATLSFLDSKSGQARRQLILNAKTKTSYSIGRDNAKVDFVLDSSRKPGMISRLHAIIRSEGSGWRIHDSSTNGICVNGKPLPVTPIRY